MKIPFYMLDTFTSPTCKGSPTSVCVLDAPISGEEMHAVAKALHCPVTAFVLSNKQKNRYDLHYYTKTGTIPACGHATLGAAKVIHELSGENYVAFRTIEDIVIETRGAGNIIFMTYPKYKPVSIDLPDVLLKGLGLQRYHSVFFCQELSTIVIELENATILQELHPEYDLLIKSSSRLKEVIVTSVSEDSAYDFLLRSFCPWIGINEDPVTGSVHSVLAPYWGSMLGRTNLKAYQASERGGEIYIKLNGNRVELGGKAISVMQAQLEI